MAFKKQVPTLVLPRKRYTLCLPDEGKLTSWKTLQTSKIDNDVKNDVARFDVGTVPGYDVYFVF